MDSLIKREFLNKVTRLNELEKSVKEIQSEIDRDFIDYYRAEEPENIKALEKHYNIEIKKIFVVKYEDDFNNWCDAVLIKTKEDKIITFDINRSEYWETDEEAIILENIEDPKINAIIIDIFSRFPYTAVEHI